LEIYIEYLCRDICFGSNLVIRIEKEAGLVLLLETFGCPGGALLIGMGALLLKVPP
jgi:hypothetical protein